MFYSFVATFLPFSNFLNYTIHFPQLCLTILNSSQNSTTFLNFFLSSKFINFPELFSTLLFLNVLWRFSTCQHFAYYLSRFLSQLKWRIWTVYYVLSQQRISPNLPLKPIACCALKATKIFPCSPKVLSGRRRGRGGGSLQN